MWQPSGVWHWIARGVVSSEIEIHVEMSLRLARQEVSPAKTSYLWRQRTIAPKIRIAPQFTHHLTHHDGPSPTMAQSFWNAAAPLISATERHPFLVSMVDGTLSLENFQYYAIQDALYLTDFAACLHLLGDKMATVNEEASQRLHRFAICAEEDEKELHRSFFKR